MCISQHFYQVRILYSSPLLKNLLINQPSQSIHNLYSKQLCIYLINLSLFYHSFYSMKNTKHNYYSPILFSQQIIILINFLHIHSSSNDVSYDFPMHSTLELFPNFIINYLNTHFNFILQYCLKIYLFHYLLFI